MRELNIDTIEVYTNNAIVDRSVFCRGKGNKLYLKHDEIVYNLYDFNCLKILIKPKVLLNKDTIFESDYMELKKTLNENLLFDLLIEDLTLNRMDYCKNLKVLEPYMSLFFKSIATKTSGCRCQIYNNYDSTVYYNQKQAVDCIYNKGLEQEERFGINKYKDTIRLEIRLLKSYLSKHKNDYSRTIEAYWNSELADSLLFNRFKSILFIGDYYNAYYANKLLKAAGIRQGMIRKLSGFRSHISINGVENAKQFYGSTFYSYKTRLEGLGINPIPIPKNNIWNMKYMPGFLTSTGFRDELLSGNYLIKKITGGKNL